MVEIVVAAQSAADYAADCSEELAQQVAQNAEFAMAVGAIWQWCQSQFSEKDAAIRQMKIELKALKTLETFKGGKYTTKIRVLFYDCLQRGMSAGSSRKLVQSMLHSLDKC